MRHAWIAVLIALAAAPAVAADGAPERSWELNLSAYGYLVPDDGSYVQPTARFDRGALHLEGRYNYEALRTGSVWAGWTFGWGEALKLSLTPMIGFSFGDFTGLGPGLELSLEWKLFEFYSEDQWIVDPADSSQNYFYAWNELAVRPREWLRAGLSLQRTRVINVPREINWGPFVGASIWKLEFTAYWFDPGQAGVQYGVFHVGVNL